MRTIYTAIALTWTRSEYLSSTRTKESSTTKGLYKRRGKRPGETSGEEISIDATRGGKTRVPPDSFLLADSSPKKSPTE